MINDSSLCMTAVHSELIIFTCHSSLTILKHFLMTHFCKSMYKGRFNGVCTMQSKPCLSHRLTGMYEDCPEE